MKHTSGLRTDHIMAVPDTSHAFSSASICSPTLLSPGKKVLLSTLDNTRQSGQLEFELKRCSNKSACFTSPSVKMEEQVFSNIDNV